MKVLPGTRYISGCYSSASPIATFPADWSVFMKCLVKSQLYHVAMINTNNTFDPKCYYNHQNTATKPESCTFVTFCKDLHTEMDIYLPSQMLFKNFMSTPIPSMYGIYTCIYHKINQMQVNIPHISSYGYVLLFLKVPLEQTTNFCIPYIWSAFEIQKDPS